MEPFAMFKGGITMANNYIYKKSETNVFTVGYYSPSGLWMPEGDHSTPDAAAKRVSILNGLSFARQIQIAANERAKDYNGMGLNDYEAIWGNFASWIGAQILLSEK